MEKNNQKIKKKNITNIIFFVLTFAIILFFYLSYIMSFEIFSNDELWNFQNVYKIYNGFLMYTDTNIIITPLFYIIGLVFFKILGPMVVVFRIYGVILSILTTYLIFVIIKGVIKDFRKSLFFTLVFSILIGNKFIGASANYNLLAMIFVLLGIVYNLKNNMYLNQKEEKEKIYKEQRKKQKNKLSYYYINTFIIFLAFLTKQNIGIYYFLSVLLYEIYTELLYDSFFKNEKINIFKKIKENRLNIFKKITGYISIISFFVMLMVLVLHIKGELNPFVNLAFLGIGEFSKNNFVKYVLYMDHRFLFVIIVFCYYFFSYCFLKKLAETKKETKEVINKVMYLNIISIPLIAISYPIFNEYHILLSIFVLSFTVVYYIDKIFTELRIYKSRIIQIGVTVIISIYLIYVYLKIGYKSAKEILENKKVLQNTDVYDYSLIDEKTKEKIESIIKYIKEKEEKNIKVIFLTHDAAQYMIPLKKSNGIFDLPFLGNMRKEGEDGAIEKISKMENTLFVIFKNKEDLFWQESIKLNEYIREKMKKVEELHDYEVYAN